MLKLGEQTKEEKESAINEILERRGLSEWEIFMNQTVVSYFMSPVEAHDLFPVEYDSIHRRITKINVLRSVGVGISLGKAMDIISGIEKINLRKACASIFTKLKPELECVEEKLNRVEGKSKHIEYDFLMSYDYFKIIDGKKVICEFSSDLPKDVVDISEVKLIDLIIDEEALRKHWPSKV